MVRRRTAKRKKRTVYPALGAAPAKKSSAWVIVILAALVVVNLYVFVWDKKTSISKVREQAERAPVPTSIPGPALPPPPPAVVDAGHTAGSAAAAPVGPPGAVDGQVGKSDRLG